MRPRRGGGEAVEWEASSTATSEDVSVLAKLGGSSSLIGGNQGGRYGCAITMAAAT